MDSDGEDVGQLVCRNRCSRRPDAQLWTTHRSQGTMVITMWRRADLHNHSNRSDGSAEPEQVVRAAAQRGVNVLSITDHHDLSAFTAARLLARRLGVTLFPGVELCCPGGASAVHVLGIFPPTLNEAEAIDNLDLEDVGLGRADRSVPYPVEDAVARIRALGGLAVAAHAAANSGLIHECRGIALRHLASSCRFDAIELADAGNPELRPRVPDVLTDIPVISGSDAHRLTDFESDAHPYGVGSRAFWVWLARPTFRNLAQALSQGRVSAAPPWLSQTGNERLDTLLSVDSRWTPGVVDDRGAHLGWIVNETVELLNGDGGHVLVGVRRRFSGATRGADLTLTPDELHEHLIREIVPSPILDVLAHQGPRGWIHEVVVLSYINSGRNYRRRSEFDTAARTRSERGALEAIGLIDVRRALQQVLGHRDQAGNLPLEKLARLFPHRDWLADQQEFISLVSQSLARQILDTENPPMWLVHWARELGRARLSYRAVYRDLVRRHEGQSHRERLQEALAASVARGALQPGERRMIETWFEERRRRTTAGERFGDLPETDVGVALERGQRVFGDDIRADLVAEGRRAAEQYNAAMQEAFGAQALTVLEAGAGDAPPIAWETLEELGVDRVLAPGATAGTGTIVAIADPLAATRAPDLLAIWAQVADPTRPARVIERCVESGKHLPVIRFARLLPDDELRATIEACERIGAAQLRNLILADLRRALDPPVAHAPAQFDIEADVTRLVADVNDASALHDVALAALVAPDRVAAAFDGRPTVRAAILRLAASGSTQTLRRPALMISGALGDATLLELWETEPSHQLRLSILDGITLLPPGEPIDRALYEALAARAGLVERAARAFASRGPAGYELLTARIPTGATERGYLIRGLIPVAGAAPDEARALAAQCCDDEQMAALGAVRELDRGLYL
jgi:PHP domain